MFEERAIPLRHRSLPVLVLFERYRSVGFVGFFRAVEGWREGAKIRLTWQIWRWAVAVTRRGAWRAARSIRSKQQQQQPGEQP